jgi:hypothetical protein
MRLKEEEIGHVSFVPASDEIFLEEVPRIRNHSRNLVNVKVWIRDHRSDL